MSRNESGQDAPLNEGLGVARAASRDIAMLLGRSNTPPLSDGSNKPTSFIHAIEAQIRRGSPVNLGTFTAVWDAIRNQNGAGLDDRKFLLEEVLTFMSRLPPRSDFATQVEHFMIDFLYKDLPHPPCTFLGPLAQSIPAPPVANAISNSNTNFANLGLKGFAYREPDGSGNNPMSPNLGAAHKPYARSVASSHVMPPSSLPDPSLVFDTLLRRDRHVEHPTGLSSCFFAFANLIIHSLFRTNRKDGRINDTSSYLDLSPLYGVDQGEQDTVRRFDGTGRLWDDVVADVRLLGMTPETFALLMIFNRNHNFVAGRILHINEGGAYSSHFSPTDEDKRRAQDNEIFNRARLVNCGAFMQVIMRDYVGCILRMIPDMTPWHLKPLEAIRESSHQITPRGEGNACSVEFNLLYRWHATTSIKNEKWLDEFWKRVFPNKGYDEVTPKDFAVAVGRDFQTQGADPRKWELRDLKRNEHTGRFDDVDLARVLQSATADPAYAFRARGVPAAFKVIEIMGIQNSRDWGVCTLNEFRTFLGLKPYKSFDEWNPNKEISNAAEQLYSHIDNLELYVGMQAEETRPSIPGSGLCSGYTMSRSILADAVALIRGDRFLTTEYTAFNLTSWGFKDVETTDDNGSLGGMLTKLLFRTLPRHYTSKSIYAHFPFIVPSRMRENMMKHDPGMVNRYDWSEPQSLSTIIPVQRTELVKEIVADKTKFSTSYDTFAKSLTSDKRPLYLCFGDSQKHMQTLTMIRNMLFNHTTNSENAHYYYERTRLLISEKSFSPVRSTTRTVNVVREVINIMPLYWVTERVVKLPLKTEDTPDGKYSEQELYGYFAVLFTYIFLNTEAVNSWFLYQHSEKAAKLLLADITAEVKEATKSFLNTVRDMLYGQHSNPQDALHKLLSNKNRGLDGDDDTDIVHILFGIAVSSVANWSHAMTHVVNFYLDSSRKSEREEIVAVAGRPFTEESERLLIGYVQEALRLDPPVAGVLREARESVEIQATQVIGGQRVCVDLAAALVDEAYVGPEPSAVNPKRPQCELSYVEGAHSSLDQEFSEKTMAQVLRALFSLKNLRRAPGPSGRLARFAETLHGVTQNVYIDTKGQTTPWPHSMHVQYDI